MKLNLTYTNIKIKFKSFKNSKTIILEANFQWARVRTNVELNVDFTGLTAKYMLAIMF